MTDLTVTPDLTRVVAVGMHYQPPPSSASDLSPGSRPDVTTSPSAGGNGASIGASRKPEKRMIVYDLATKQTELCVSTPVLLDVCQLTHYIAHRSIPLEGELTSVKVSRDSQYALLNHAPDVSTTILPAL